MKLWIAFLLSGLLTLWAGLPHTESFKTIQGIRPYAIQLGVGITEIFVFVDPMCPKSRAYIKQISTSGNLLRKHRYFIFLYRLPKFESDHLIRTIYTSSNPRLMMQKIMIDRCAPEALKGHNDAYADETIDAVAEAGMLLGMEHRPYLMIFKPTAPYCIVSEGEPDCIDPAKKE
jgi:hypothetical protein